MTRLVLVLFYTLNVAAQNLSYSLLASTSPPPSPRVDGAVAYDPAGRQILLFGGQDAAARNDLWAYSLTQRRWSEVPASGTLPPARFGHTLVFDSARRRLIVFGGQASGFFNDVWAFDLATSTWRQLSSGNTGPSRRYGHSAVIDTARDRMVISHGFTNAGRFDDTWAFHLATNSWRDISPTANRPLRRCLHHAAYDPERGLMYLYGGCSSGSGPCPQGDLWSFDLSTNRWTERTPGNSPPPRQHYGMAFDEMRGKLVVFGGSGNGLLNDTWEYDPRASSWQSAPISGALPSARDRHHAVYAADRGVVFFFGGSTSAGLTNELWMLGPGFLSDRPLVARAGIVNAFSGEGAGIIAPGEIVSIFGSGLGPVTGVALQFDAEAGQLPTSGPGVAVTWNGIPAPLHYLQAEQLNVQVPNDLAGATQATLTVTVNGRSSDPVTLRVQPARPGLFPRIWNQDGTINSPENPAAPNSIIVLYATGQGATAPATLRIADLEAPILFQGAPSGTSGVLQVNARVPERAPSANDAPVVLSIGTISSQPGVRLAIR
jgi:uncharacterized protein (TIGR03437 family)